MSTTIDELKELRDEIKVKLHLAGMEAKQQWQQLEPRLVEIEAKLEHGTETAVRVAQEVVDELGGAFQRLLDRVRDDAPAYGFRKHLDSVTFEEARQRIVETLAAEGFGVLTEIDVKATLKKKLDVDHRPYVILGACNPALAKRALEIEPAIGLLLPCNVVVQESPGGGVDLMVIDPAAMFKVVVNPAVGEIATEVEAKLRRALDNAAR